MTRPRSEIEGSEYKARSGVSRVGEVSVKADTFWLELGHVRALIAAADEIGLPDEASIRFGGIQKHYTYVGEFTATTAHVSGVPAAPAAQEGESRG